MRWREEEVSYLKTYYNRYNVEKISNYLGRNCQSIKQKAYYLGLSKKFILTKDDEKKICELYINDKKTCFNLSLIFSVNPETIRNVLICYNILRRQEKNIKHIYSCNWNYFDTLTEESTYWLGFCAGDASLTRYKLTLQLSRKDENHLIKFKNCLQCSYLIRRRDNYWKGNYTPSSVLEINSKYICNKLREYGIGPCKSLTLEYPKNIPEGLNRHFIRGIFCSDGCFSFKQNIKTECSISIVGPKNFLWAIENIFHNEAGLKKRNKLYEKGKIFSLAYGGRNQVKCIFDYMYKDATVYLDRKYEKLCAYFNV